MTRRLSLLVAAAAAAAVLAGWPCYASAQEPSAEQERAYEWNEVSRIVALGDVHGAYDNLVRVLQNADVIDEKERWIAGTAHLVQNGDIVDRGPDSRKAMDLLMKLEGEAAEAGGSVHVLIGNHEAMNVVGILDLVSEEEFRSYVDRDSRRLRDAAFERYYEDLRRQAGEKGDRPRRKRNVKREFEEEYPLGYIEHRRAFAADGRYGSWIRGLNTGIRINGIVFSHGDWSEKFSAIGLEEVNRRVRRELAGELPLGNGVTFDPDSPLQYRGLAHTPLTREAQSSMLPKVERILANLSASRMVVGHTITSGTIESRFGGRHISIDTGMLPLYRGGHRVALEVKDGRLYAVHDGGRVEIPDTLDESSYLDYLRAVAEVDPVNVDVQTQLVDALSDAGRAEEAATILERLFARSDFVPFRYREFLGAQYEQRGDSKKAKEQFLEYIDGLRRLVEASRENVNLANLLARFCVEKSLRLELALETIRDAVDRAPDNPALSLTLARVHIARGEYGKSLTRLAGIPANSGYEYDVHYATGLAYLGLDDRERARAEFESALEAEPERSEVLEQLRKLNHER